VSAETSFETDGGPTIEGTPEACAEAYRTFMASRRSVRAFSDAPVSEAVIRSIVQTAAAAPSGANKQPWSFVCVQDPDLKREIRTAAEAEERLFYGERASQRWLDDLKPFETTADKPFLETAPWLIVVFKVARGTAGEQHYYVTESVGIATGFLLAAIHHAGLVALTHTPSPMEFLGNILGRPHTEKPFLLIPVGHPALNCEVPELTRKPLDEIMFIDRG
jgi:iodotyrosine deiodinase